MNLLESECSSYSKQETQVFRANGKSGQQNSGHTPSIVVQSQATRFTFLLWTHWVAWALSPSLSPHCEMGVLHMPTRGAVTMQLLRRAPEEALSLGPYDRSRTQATSEVLTGILTVSLVKRFLKKPWNT